MKSFKEVEQNRRDYHRDAALNSVHRASLTVPELEGSIAEISFLNHFLIKRGYRNVACRITALDAEGKRIESRLHVIDEPRVYSLPLTGAFDANVETYHVEYYCGENLFIPFPAVMVNHLGDGFLNSVHAYNRVLNDVFEDDAINSTRVAEASIDVRVDDNTDTFGVFTAGQQRCQGTLDVELTSGNGAMKSEIALDIPRFCNQEFSLKNLFPEMTPGTTGTLRIWQPQQFLFYGRMLTGMRTADGAFSANHSYYDNSTTTEYWDDDRESVRLYPLFDGLAAHIRMYPIMSPGQLAIMLDAYGPNGEHLGSVEAGTLENAGSDFLDINVTAVLAKAGLGGSESFAVRAKPVSGNTPTRVNHQLVYGDGDGRSPLSASINVSLTNPNVFIPPKKTGLIWGQLPVGADLDSFLAVTPLRPLERNDRLALSIYGPDGLVAETDLDLKASGACHIDTAALLKDRTTLLASDPPVNLWYFATCAQPEVGAYVVTRHRETGHCSGEHNF